MSKWGSKMARPGSLAPGHPPQLSGARLSGPQGQYLPKVHAQLQAIHQVSILLPETPHRRLLTPAGIRTSNMKMEVGRANHYATGTSQHLTDGYTEVYNIASSAPLCPKKNNIAKKHFPAKMIKKYFHYLCTKAKNDSSGRQMNKLSCCQIMHWFNK